METPAEITHLKTKSEIQTCSLRSSPGDEMEAATEAPADRTAVLAFVDTVLIQEEIILKEFGSNLLVFPLPFFISTPILNRFPVFLNFNLSQPPPPHRKGPNPVHRRRAPPPHRPTRQPSFSRSSNSTITGGNDGNAAKHSQ